MELDVRAFIAEIKNHPALWDVNHSDYPIREKKNDAWKEIIDIFINNEHASPEERLIFGQQLHRRWKSLRDGYAREIKLQKEAAKEKNPRKRPVYVFFKDLSFLEKILQSSSKIPEKPQTPLSVVTVSPKSHLNLRMSSRISKSSKAMPTVTESSKRQKLVESVIEAALDSNHAPATVATQSAECQKPILPPSSTDPYHTYGLHIANELRKYDPKTLAHVKMSFADILFRADMGQLVDSNLSQEVSNSDNVYHDDSTFGDGGNSPNVYLYE